ncbi:amidase domain-containing protein [Natronospora cellulosivora (SeqCode)]
MIFIIKCNYKKIIYFLLIIFLIAIISNFYLQRKVLRPVLDEETNAFLYSMVQEIFDIRNDTILKEDLPQLESLYNTNVRNGIWAYEHELKKAKYLHEWSEKQSIEFKSIVSNIIVRYANEKNDGYSINLMVNTEYQYNYLDEPEVLNSFRIGTYHTLDLMPYDEEWLITKEWYTDPFADSLNTDDLENPKISEIINSQEAKDLKNLKQKRLDAIEYLDKYCGAATLPEYGYKYNTDYRDYNHLGGDCANFASQMLYEAGGFTKGGTWNYANGAGSRAWLNADAFNNFMVYSGRGTRIARGSYAEVLKASYNLLPGDYIAYEKKGKVVHISLVSGIDSKGYILVNSHNTDRYRVPWDLGWSNKGIKFHLVRVHF